MYVCLYVPYRRPNRPTDFNETCRDRLSCSQDGFCKVWWKSIHMAPPHRLLKVPRHSNSNGLFTKKNILLYTKHQYTVLHITGNWCSFTFHLQIVSHISFNQYNNETASLCPSPNIHHFIFRFIFLLRYYFKYFALFSCYI
jgi:hypothetical protein